MTAACCGWLLGILCVKIEDEDNPCNDLEDVISSLHTARKGKTKHNEVADMNRRKLDNLDVEAQQREMSKAFSAFRLVIALLVLCAAVAVAFAIHYSL